MLTAVLRWWLALPAILLLLPVLLLQGRRVRRMVPKLHAASGPAAGRVGEPAGPVNSVDGRRLLAVGDSVAAGVGVAELAQSIPAVTASVLAQAESKVVAWSAHGVDGDNVANVVARVPTLPRSSVDIVLVSVGVNDVTGFTSLIRWQAGLLSLCMALRERFSSACIVFLGLPPLRQFPTLPQPLRWALGARAALLESVLVRVAELMDAVSVVSLAQAFDPKGMAEDGFHPGPEAHEVMGRLVADHVRQQALLRA